MENTKNVNHIIASKEFLENYTQYDYIKFLQDKDYDKISDIFKPLIKEVSSILSRKNEDYIKAKINKNSIIYVKKYNMIVPDLKNYTAKSINIKSNMKTSDLNVEFFGFYGQVLKKNIAIDIFYKDTNSPFKGKNFKNIICVGEKNKLGYTDGEGITYFNGLLKSVNAKFIPVYRLDTNINILEFFVKNDILLENISKESKDLFNLFKCLYDLNFIEIDKKIRFTKKARKSSSEKQIIDIFDANYKNKKIVKDYKIDIINTDLIDKSLLLKDYLECDKERADIEPYDIKRLEDPNMGHWDLWSINEDYDICVKTDKSFVARNPICDINRDCIVGIDFGTKSTIVVYQDKNANTQPMRIGVGRLSKETKFSDFENPTVMEFINISEFMKNYNADKSRPHTSWNDLTISHTANNSLVDVNVKSDEFYSFFYDLKQWAGNGLSQIRLRDKSKQDLQLPAYLDIDEDEFDPIQVYAYYIGLNINNMHNGIYTDYLLSFPVTYEKEVRAKITKSFEKGIKKSLPREIVEDEDVMESFRVKQGVSEPAAYAICVLQEYGFDPEDDEKIFYGIFDFGGGTTDFDFGTWKSLDDDWYDYEINHFGDGGDKFLGGENLLELLAFNVFCDNINICRKENISFQKPIELSISEDIRFFISNSQEAKMNMKQMMEKLRPFWERTDDKYASDYENGIKIHLFDRNGEAKMNLGLKVDIIKLEKVLNDRIEQGVKQFFEALKLTFDKKREEQTKDVKKINIFLAGNSSKSPILKSIFAKYIQEETESIKKLQDCEKYSDDVFFEIFPSLGTEESRNIQLQRNIKINESITAPTGKTGVAYGLIDGRDGGRIKIISEVNSETEAKFSYFIGINKKKRFNLKISRDVKYNTWTKFLSAMNYEFEIYYTSLPEATSNKLYINENGVLKKRCKISKIGDDLYIYIRFVKPSVIEYAIGDSNVKIDENTIQELVLDYV